jgi:AraC-like DNA-binding protein
MDNIKKENFSLNELFPFSVSNSLLPPHFNMGKKFHWHDCLEISYIKSGKGRYYIEDEIYEMGPGNIIIINNIEPHYIEVYEEEMNQPVVIFDPSLICSDGASSLDNDYLKPFFERGTDFSNKLDINNPISYEIMTHLNAIEKEFSEKPEGYQLMIKARLLMILTYLLRYFRDGSKLDSCYYNKRQNLLRLEEVIKYINEGFANEMTLNDAASRIHVTPQYFSTFFKKVTGKTFIGYLNNVRIIHAIKLLRETDNKITHIAMECGFNNTTNFNNMFKKAMGKTPSQVRRE